MFTANQLYGTVSYIKTRVSYSVYFYVGVATNLVLLVAKHQHCSV